MLKMFQKAFLIVCYDYIRKSNDIWQMCLIEMILNWYKLMLINYCKKYRFCQMSENFCNHEKRPIIYDKSDMHLMFTSISKRFFQLWSTKYKIYKVLKMNVFTLAPSMLLLELMKVWDTLLFCCHTRSNWKASNLDWSPKWVALHSE